jgi:hypothetical protein
VSVRAVRVGSGQGHCTRWNNVSSPAFRKRPNGGTLVGRLAVGDGSIRLTVSVNTLVTPASPPNTLLKRIPVLERGWPIWLRSPPGPPIECVQRRGRRGRCQVKLRRRTGRPCPKGPVKDTRSVIALTGISSPRAMVSNRIRRFPPAVADARQQAWGWSSIAPVSVTAAACCPFDRAVRDACGGLRRAPDWECCSRW